jgi:hypothetical protein
MRRCPDKGFTRTRTEMVKRKWWKSAIEGEKYLRGKGHLLKQRVIGCDQRGSRD